MKPTQAILNLRKAAANREAERLAAEDRANEFKHLLGKQVNLVATNQHFTGLFTGILHRPEFIAFEISYTHQVIITNVIAVTEYHEPEPARNPLRSTLR